MASRKEYLDFILEQLSELEEIAYRAMMGEYIIYYRGKSALCSLTIYVEIHNKTRQISQEI